jgi:hypothetical protein
MFSTEGGHFQLMVVFLKSGSLNICSIFFIIRGTFSTEGEHFQLKGKMFSTEGVHL